MTPLSNFFLDFSFSYGADPLFILIGIFFIFLSSWIYTQTKRLGSSPPLPPGPTGLPLVGNLPFLDPELHTYFAGLARKYGPVLKLRLGAKTAVVVTSPAAAREILKDHDLIFANRDVPATGRAATYGGIDVVWSPYGPEWRTLRKVCVVKMLSNTTLDSVYALRRQEIRGTVEYLYGQAGKGSPVNIGEQMFLTILNVITNMLWGGTVKGEERAGLGAEFRQLVSEMTELLGQPNVSDFFPSLTRFDLQGLMKRMDGAAQRFDRMFERIIDQRLRIERDGGSEGGDNSNDFLQFLLKLKEEGDSKTPLTMNHVKALLMDMVVGGSDTSSNTIEFAMIELINKPETLKKAQRELDEVIGKGNIVEESHITKLPYLQAVMKETLRLHPVLPLLVPHCPTQTCTVSGYTIPKGSRVFINVWAIHRDPKIWENPLQFNPERFLVRDDNDKKSWDFSGSDFSYFPFGSGRRICAGIAMAERMVLYSLSTLLHSFDWKVPEGKGLDREEKFGIVLKLKNPLVALPVPRLSDPKLYQ